ncbi:MAG: hypothetical protein RL148_2034 [Planctomycetota bacterium]|jgi:ABC-type Fe3+/spermidine/putrescine transport system ATPase subunit
MSSVALSALTLHRKAGFRLGPVSLAIAAGQRVALVGPSGCGKTTLLRLLAGLERAASGTISFDGRLATDGNRLVLPPQDRGIGFVFQDGALWPHLDAAAQLRFVDRGLTAAGAAALLARVGLAGKDHRTVDSLSGGERQRLALARALAGSPRMLLLDEPLHSVDVHLREELALLIRSVAEERGLTMVVVTHDRGEALAMADQLVVLQSGTVVESGPAAELLHQPRTAFAAAFLGGAACHDLVAESPMRARSAWGSFELPRGASATSHRHVVLPGDVRLDPAGPVQGRVLQVLPAHGGLELKVAVDGRVHSVATEPSSALRAGDAVRLALTAAPRLLPLGGAA